METVTENTTSEEEQKPVATVRTFSEDEKRKLLKQYEELRKEGMLQDAALKKLGFGRSAYERWRKNMAKFGSPNDPNAGTTNQTLSHVEKLKVVKRFKSGEDVRALAKELDVTPDSIRNWAKGKYLGSPNQSGVVHKRGPLKKSRLSYLEKLKIVKRFKNGENYKALAREVGVHESAIHFWSKGKNLGKPEGKATGKAVAAKPKGGHLVPVSQSIRTRALMRLSNGEKPKDIAKDLKITVSAIYNWVKVAKQKREMEHANSAFVETPVVASEALPAIADTGRGSRIAQAIVMLQFAERAVNKQIKSGALTVSNPIVNYTMMALARLKGED